MAFRPHVHGRRRRDRRLGQVERAARQQPAAQREQSDHDGQYDKVAPHEGVKLMPITSAEWHGGSVMSDVPEPEVEPEPDAPVEDEPEEEAG